METSAPLPARARATQRSTPRRQTWRRYNPLTFYGFIAPWLIGFLGLTVIPLVYALAVSFTNFDGLSDRWRWVGLRNYVEALHSPDTWLSLGRSLTYMVVTIPLSIAGGLALAVLLNQRIRAVGFFRTLFYLPAVVPVVSSAFMFKLLLDRDTGSVNAITALLHIPAISWLVDPNAFWALCLLVLWGLGGGMVISLAGLQGVPMELQEAAQIDGASAWQAFRHVSLPLLSPVIFFQVVTGVIFSFNTFVQVQLLIPGNGGSNTGTTLYPRSTFLYMVNVWQQFFQSQRFGYGSALLWLLFLIVMGLTILLFRSSAFWVYYEVERD